MGMGGGWMEALMVGPVALAAVAVAFSRPRTRRTSGAIRPADTRRLVGFSGTAGVLNLLAAAGSILHPGAGYVLAVLFTALSVLQVGLAVALVVRAEPVRVWVGASLAAAQAVLWMLSHWAGIALVRVHGPIGVSITHLHGSIRVMVMPLSTIVTRGTELALVLEVGYLLSASGLLRIGEGARKVSECTPRGASSAG